MRELPLVGLKQPLFHIPPSASTWTPADVLGDADTVEVSVFPQDPEGSHQPVRIAFPKDEIVPDGNALVNKRFGTENDRAPRPIRPDEHGNFIFEPGSPEFDVVSAHVYATQVLHMVEAYRQAPVPWQYGNERRQRMAVHVNQAHDGNSITRFGPREIVLNSYRSTALHKEIKDAESAEATAHETGHAILRGLRPNAGADLESSGFHESFGDIVAILYSLQFPQNVTSAVQETHGDLKRQNCISRLFEEDGRATALHDKTPTPDGYYIRTALNDAVYHTPGDDDDEHDVAMSFTGGFYDTLVALYERNRAAGQAPEAALTTARDTLGRVWGESTKHLPSKHLTFQAGLGALLKADQALGAGLSAVLRKAFARHGIR